MLASMLTLVLGVNDSVQINVVLRSDNANGNAIVNADT